MAPGKTGEIYRVCHQIGRKVDDSDPIYANTLDGLAKVQKSHLASFKVKGFVLVSKDLDYYHDDDPRLVQKS